MAINEVLPDVNPVQIAKVIPPHLEWTKQKISKGVIVQAGKWGDAGGMVILRANELSEAESLLREDPLIISELVTFKLAPLYPEVKI